MKSIQEKVKIDFNYLRSLILYTLICIFILLCSVLIFLMFINIYHHYKFPGIQSINHYRHNQWYHHNQQRKPDGIIMNVLIKQIDQQTSTLSTTIGSPTGSSSTDLITKNQGILIKPYMDQGVDSYVQSVLESTFKTTKELTDQKRNPAIN